MEELEKFYQKHLEGLPYSGCDETLQLAKDVIEEVIRAGYISVEEINLLQALSKKIKNTEMREALEACFLR